MQYRVHFRDGHIETITAADGTAAKAAARKAYGKRKEECPIARVEPVDPAPTAGDAGQNGGH